MSKRESGTILEEFLVGYFKKRKYHKTSKLFEKARIQKHPTGKPWYEEKFQQYLKKKIVKSKNEKIIDNLDFEINFDAYQYDTKVKLRVPSLVFPMLVVSKSMSLGNA